MNNLVDKPILSTLYNSVQDRSYAAPPAIHVFVTHYKTPSYLRKCLDSLFSQECSVPMIVYLIDDASNMKEVDDLLSEWEKKEPLRLRVKRNLERQNKGRNLFACLEMNTFHPESVICVVDGDDWLAHPNAFQRMVDEYVKTGCWMTYGSYTCSDGKTGNCTTPLTPLHLQSEAMGRGFREAPWIFSHLFSAKAFLWKQVDSKILDFGGKIEDGGAPDQIFNIPIAEMASSKHISHIPDILYVYNNQSSLNEFVVRPQEQLEYDQKNRQRPATRPIERPPIDCLVILPCRGRFPLLHATVERFQKIVDPTFHTEIVLVEHSETPSYKDYAKQKGIGWLYIPMSTSQTSPLGQFNRGLCFDIGFLYGTKARYYLCHDNDLLVPSDFWKKLQENFQVQQVEILQTYSDRFVWQTSQEVSQTILNNPSWFDNGFVLETHCTQNPPGAKGGSITLSREAYLKLGGHDPHLFFGYAAEDAFFWSKVEQHYKVGFAESPRIPLVHLWHPNAANLNPLKEPMDLLFYMFHAVHPHQKREYIEKKSEHFKSSLKIE